MRGTERCIFHSCLQVLVTLSTWRGQSRPPLPTLRNLCTWTRLDPGILTTKSSSAAYAWHCLHFYQPQRRWRAKPSSPSALFHFRQVRLPAALVLSWWEDAWSRGWRVILIIDERTGFMWCIFCIVDFRRLGIVLKISVSPLEAVPTLRRSINIRQVGQTVGDFISTTLIPSFSFKQSTSLLYT